MSANQTSLVELKIEILPSDTESIDNLLLEMGNDRWSLLEDAIAKRAWIAGIFPSENEAQLCWQELRAALRPLYFQIPTMRVLEDQDWRDSYKIHFKAWKFGRLHWVPVWEKPIFQLPAGDEVLWLDPGLAFGTGNHETTRLVVERLVAYAEKKETYDGSTKNLRVIDAGCGSGILSLSAVKLGFEHVVGFDNDPEAVRISEENAGLNESVGRVRFFVGDLVSGLAGEQGDLLMANIQADVLKKFASELIRAVAPGGTLVLSGILAVELDSVKSTFGSMVPTWTMNSRVMGEWSDVCLSRSN